MLNEYRILIALAKRADVTLSKNLKAPNRNFWELWIEHENPQDKKSLDMIENIVCDIVEYYTRNLPSQFLWVEFDDKGDTSIIEHSANTPIQAMREFADLLIESGLENGRVYVHG